MPYKDPGRKAVYDKVYREANRERRNAYHREYCRTNRETISGVSRGAIGAACEYIVASALMLAGFSVTRPLDPYARHDLHAEFPSVGWKGIQVKKVVVNRNTGLWTFAKQNRPRTSPIYALVNALTSEIRYEAGTEPLPPELQ